MTFNPQPKAIRSSRFESAIIKDPQPKDRRLAGPKGFKIFWTDGNQPGQIFSYVLYQALKITDKRHQVQRRLTKHEAQTIAAYETERNNKKQLKFYVVPIRFKKTQCSDHVRFLSI
tara:strand:- start:501 stop:848 length:348 start_codon:yes stop_codon:yes gene_type:complete